MTRTLVTLDPAIGIADCCPLILGLRRRVDGTSGVCVLRRACRIGGELISHVGASLGRDLDAMIELSCGELESRGGDHGAKRRKQTNQHNAKPLRSLKSYGRSTLERFMVRA